MCSRERVAVVVGHIRVCEVAVAAVDGYMYVCMHARAYVGVYVYAGMLHAQVCVCVC